MAIPFATWQDVASRTGEVYTSSEQDRIDCLCEDASQIIISYGFNPDTTDENKQYSAKVVCCNMVNRLISSQNAAGSLSQITETAGVFSQSMSFANVGEALYVTKRELRMLGISSSAGRIIEAYNCLEGDNA